MGRLFWSGTCAVVLELHRAPRSAILDAQEAFVGVGFVVGAADRLKVLWAHAGASLESERGQTPFHRHHVHVLAAVLLAHRALAAIELVVRAAHKLRLLAATVVVAIGRRSTVFQRNRNHACATCFLFHFAQSAIDVAIGRTNGPSRTVIFRAFFAAVEQIGLQLGAGTDVSQLHVPSTIVVSFHSAEPGAQEQQQAQRNAR